MKKVTAAILTNNGRVLIARRKAGRRLANMWEFPGGRLNSEETPVECLKRALKEKLGIEIQVGGFFGESIYHYEYGSIQLLGFWATLVSGEILPSAHQEVEWVSPDELDRYIFVPADIPFVDKLQRKRLWGLYRG